jgi:flagellar hook assembly protein FlgD
VSVDLYDATGRLVRKLAECWQKPGIHEIRWDGRDSRNREMPSGVYFVRLRTPSEAAARKIVKIE